MKKKTWMTLFIMSVWMSLIFGVTAFGATWRTGMSPNENRWWYDNEDGTWANNGWYWLDGNQDGIAECYYFDQEGWMAVSTTTPDGYQVNEDGAWVSDGVVVTRNAVREPDKPQEANQLVVYFTRTGTTQRAAARISQLTGASMAEIEAAQPYSGSYQETLSRAQDELNRDARPAVTTFVENMAQYDIIYVGYPIWHGTLPRPVLTFLEQYDLSGKTIVPFCTSGSSGVAESVRELRNNFPGINVTSGQRVNDTSVIESWLSGLGLLR